MINLRYHIITITAIFLALGIGVIMGTTVVKEGVVTSLRADIRRQESRSDRLEAENGVLHSEVSLWEGFGNGVSQEFARGRLAGRTVLLLAQSGAADELVSGTQSAIVGAGAAVAGLIRLTDRWSLREESWREQLRLALGATDPSADPTAEAAARVAARIRAPAPVEKDDLLSSLAGAGFLKLESLKPGAFPPAGFLLVVVSGGSDQGWPGVDPFFVPLLRAVTEPAAVVEPLGASVSLAERVRGDSQLAKKVATIDDGDTLPGQLSLVYALRDVAAGKAPSHYGTRRGATSVGPRLGP